MIVRVVQVHVLRELAQVLLAVDEVGLEHLFEAAKAVKPRGIFRERGIGDMGIVRGEEMIAVVAYHLFHRHVGVLAGPRRLRPSGLINNGKLKAIAEVDETFAMAVQVQVDAAMLVVIIRLWRTIGVREANPARVVLNNLWVITGIAASAAIGGRPVGLLELGGVLAG